MQNNRINTTELDFDKIKANLKNYLKGQSEFSDYDFEGSNMSILLDLLAYNTHYNSLYNNLAVNESFLDSASKRSSVVSIAKELNYVPSSARCSSATVTVTVTVAGNNPLTVLEIPKYSAFSTIVNGTTYTFYTQQVYTAYRVGNTFTFTGVVIKEGKPLALRYIVANEMSYSIPNPDVDLSTLTVKVQDTAQSTVFQTFTRNENILDANVNAAVYFIKEIEGQFYEIEFGNGVVGKALDTGNVVNLEYMVCNKEAPNGARSFTFQGSLASNATVSVATTIAAAGGSDIEDIDLIRWNAPRAFASQNRCVTLDDYKSIIYQNYPNAETVNVWGGESNVPVSYGDVFISVKPKDGLTLTDEEKAFLLNDVLAPRKLVTMHPKFVDPTYINIELAVSFYYDPGQTTYKASDLAYLVQQAIVDYNTADLRKFGSIFKQSIISRLIDDTEKSIKSNIFTIKLHREVDPIYNQAPNYDIQLVNPIYNSGVPEESILSTGIYVKNVPQLCFIDDVPTEGSNIGALRLFYYVQNTKIFVKNVGTVDYANGVINVNNLIITGLGSDVFKFVVKPQSNDVISVRNQIVNIEPTLLTITPIVDTNAEQYKFTSSRN